MKDIQIVAEIGCNHNGNVELAKEMMKRAKEAGADAVKFQSFVPENLVSKYAPKAEYQKQNDGNGSQLDMLKKLALTEDEYLELIQYAKNLNIGIFSTPFDSDSFSFLQRIVKILPLVFYPYRVQSVFFRHEHFCASMFDTL